MRWVPLQVAHLTSELGELRLQLAEAGGQSADRSARAEQELRSLRQQLGAATGQLMGRDQEVQMLQERLQVGKLWHPSLHPKLVCCCAHCGMHDAAGLLQKSHVRSVEWEPQHLSYTRAWYVADHAALHQGYRTPGRLQDLTDKLADARVQAAERVTLAQQHSGQPAWQAQMAELQSKLALTTQKLTTRDASARKYKVGTSIGITKGCIACWLCCRGAQTQHLHKLWQVLTAEATAAMLLRTMAATSALQRSAVSVVKPGGEQPIYKPGLGVVQDAVRALKAKLSQASAAIQAGQEESLQLKHQIAKLHTAVALVRCWPSSAAQHSCLVTWEGGHRSALPAQYLPCQACSTAGSGIVSMAHAAEACHCAEVPSKLP